MMQASLESQLTAPGGVAAAMQLRRQQRQEKQQQQRRDSHMLTAPPHTCPLPASHTRPMDPHQLAAAIPAEDSRRPGAAPPATSAMHAEGGASGAIPPPQAAGAAGGLLRAARGHDAAAPGAAAAAAVEESEGQYTASAVALGGAIAGVQIAPDSCPATAAAAAALRAGAGAAPAGKQVAFATEQLLTFKNQIMAFRLLKRNVVLDGAQLAGCQPIPLAAAASTSGAGGGSSASPSAPAAAGGAGASTSAAAGADRPFKKAKLEAAAPEAAGDLMLTPALAQHLAELGKQVLELVATTKRQNALILEYAEQRQLADEMQKKELQDMEDVINEELLCQICFERKRDTLIEPCSHMMFCRSCLDRHWRGVRTAERECPCCRASVRKARTSIFINS